MRKLAPAKVAEIGRLLFGDRWKHPMSEAFGVHKNTPHNWERSGADRNAFLGHVALELAKRDEISQRLRDFLIDEMC